MLLRTHAPGLTPHAVVEELATDHFVDVHVPVVGSRHLVMRRYTQPDKPHAMLLENPGLRLPERLPPKLYQNRAVGGVSLSPEPERPCHAATAL